MARFKEADGWIVVSKDGVCYESFARTRVEAIEQYVETVKLWSWAMRNDDERVIKATLRKR